MKFRIFRLFLSCCHVRGDNSAILSSEVTGAGLPRSHGGRLCGPRGSPAQGAALRAGETLASSPQKPESSRTGGSQTRGLPSAVAAAAEPGIAGFVGG